MIYNDQTFIIHLYAFLKKKFIIRHLTSARKARKARKAIKVRKARKARKTRKARKARKAKDKLSDKLKDKLKDELKDKLKNKLKDMPLDEESVALDESVGLCFKQFLGLGFFRAPLESVALFVE